MEAVALFSFPATEADELSFQEGDIVKVTAAFDFLLRLLKLDKALHDCNIGLCLCL